MQILVPFAVERPKTRLGDVLGSEERRGFARAMLADVLGAIHETGREATVLATAPLDVDAPVEVDDRPLTDAVNARLEGAVAVVMADLPLATPPAIESLFEPAAEVVLAPGMGGGTNALVSAHPNFGVDYHGASVRDHRRIADEIGASVATVDSFRLAVDVDEPADLAEVLLHGEGAARDWLVDAGFVLDAGDGRVAVRRE